MKFKEADGKKG